MSEKVKVPKEVCDALDLATKIRTPVQILSNITNKSWVMANYSILNNVEVNTIMRALVLGYEPELTAEEKIKEAYLLNKDMEIKDVFEQGMQVGYSMGVRETLRIHGIYYDWLEGDAE